MARTPNRFSRHRNRRGCMQDYPRTWSYPFLRRSATSWDTRVQRDISASITVTCSISTWSICFQDVELKYVRILWGMSEWLLLRTPFEVVKQQMQLGLDHRLRDAFANIYKLRGFRGFYAGYSSLLLREIPYSAIQMPTYEWMKRFTKRHKSDNSKGFTWWENARNGIVAGSTGSRVTTNHHSRIHYHSNRCGQDQTHDIEKRRVPKHVAMREESTRNRWSDGLLSRRSFKSDKHRVSVGDILLCIWNCVSHHRTYRSLMLK